ncbi:MAG TPA: hypothetical protein VGL22_18220 [Terracidiphilus sp.]
MHKPISGVTMAICMLAAFLAHAEGNAAREPQDASTPKVHVISAGQMSAEDAEVLAGKHEAIASAAELNGYDILSGSWIRNQVVCPEAPRHLIMHYLKISPDGSVSLFTAAVPRDAEVDQKLHVRIIPVLYHGAPAFHVFGSSPSQRQLMNEVISTKSLASPPTPDNEWKNLAFCYAALAGAEPTSKSVTAPEEITPTLEVGDDKKVREMRFSVLGPDHLLQDWRIVFDRQALVKEIFLSAKPMRPGELVPSSTQTQAVSPSEPAKPATEPGPPKPATDTSAKPATEPSSPAAEPPSQPVTEPRHSKQKTIPDPPRPQPKPIPPIQ